MARSEDAGSAPADGTAPHGDATVPFHLWPPVAVGLPLLVGVVLTWTLGDPVDLGGWRVPVGWALLVAFALWNGWALVHFRRHRTGLLPGQPTRVIMTSGPFARSRNPLYVGLLALHLGLALLAPSFWALVLSPVSVGLLLWGAVLPEERLLTRAFGDEYLSYAASVRRWL
jgi:protein-S-isoprenylcysteine O-methyltransferase Ste14